MTNDREFRVMSPLLFFIQSYFSNRPYQDAERSFSLAMNIIAVLLVPAEKTQAELDAITSQLESPNQ